MNFAGIVLAGGRSSRMGQDKALLSHRGERLVDRMIRLIERAFGSLDATPSRIYVSGHVPGCHCIEDSMPGLGPLGGILSVLEWLDSPASDSAASHLLFVPIDMPELTPGLLMKLASCHSQADSVHYENFNFPLLLRNTPRARQTIRALCEKQNPVERSVRELHRRLDGVELRIFAGQERHFANLNTPSDWEFYRERTGAA